MSDIQFRRMQSEQSTVSSPASDKSETRQKIDSFITSYATRFLLLLTLCAFIGVGLPIIWTHVWKPKSDFGIESDLRYECLPLRGDPKVDNITARCLSYDPICLWDNFTTSPNEIACYYAQETPNQIKHENFNSDYWGKLPRFQVIFKDPKKEGQEVTSGPNLTNPRQFDDPNVNLLKLAHLPPYLNHSNDDLRHDPLVHEFLSVHVRHYGANHLSVLIKPVNDDEHLWSKYLDFNYPPVDPNITDSNAEWFITPTRSSARKDIFQLQVNRKSSHANVFNMDLNTPFVFTKGYIEISTLLVNDLVYGLGQSNLQTFRHNFSYPKSWTLVNQYSQNLTENVTSMFGSHPFYMGIDDPKKGDAYGVLLLNSHPIHVTTNARPSLTFKTYGGHLEFHFFLGPRPADVMRQLQSFIHRPAMPPYWALGFHACASLCSIPSPTMADTLTRNDIPVESDCGTAFRSRGDASLSDFRNFKSNIGDRKFLSVEAPQRFDTRQNEAVWKEYSLQVERHDYNGPYNGSMHYCPSSIASTDLVYYPDVFNPTVKDLYKRSPDLLKDYADGYLLDYNTPLNLENNNGSIVCAELMAKYPWNVVNFGKLNEWNPCMDVTFSRGSFFGRLTKKEQEAFELSQYMALHNLYGYKHAEMIYQIAIESQQSTEKTRPLIMSLATFLGSGRYGGHVGAPLNSNWTSLRLSLKQTLDFSLFGIPLSGFPVGGFRGEMPKDEVLRRWFQLAAVQPFMISYTDWKVEPRSLVASVRETIRSNVQARYKLLPYYYTLFHKASESGSLVVQPVFMEFPNDTEVYKINSTQFMIGSALLATPVVEEAVTMVEAYFPKGRWYEFYSGHLTSKKDGGTQEISAVEQNINLHIRGGHAVVNHFKTGLTIKATRKDHGFQVIAALNEEKHAHGDLFLDDGITLKVDGDGWLERSMTVNFEFNYENITIAVHEVNEFCKYKKLTLADSINTKLENVKVYGIIEKPKDGQVTLWQGHSHDTLKVSVLIQEPAVKYANNFGVLSVDTGTHIDLCDLTGNGRAFKISWTIEDEIYE